MRLIFLTNMLAYHQLQLARHLGAILGEDNFRFAVYGEITPERLQMGWQSEDIDDFVLRHYIPRDRQQILEWIKTADVVVHGRFPEPLVRKRILSGKLSLSYEERYWKKPPSRSRRFRRWHSLRRNYHQLQHANHHLLAAGSLAAADMREMGLFAQRMWKFGYFIDSSPAQIRKPSAAVTLIYCGRLIDLKQVNQALEIVANLHSAGVECRLNIIGDGPMRSILEQQAQHLNIADRTHFLGWLDRAEIDQQLAAADVLLLTSNRQEGWGLVVNEAMNQGCCIVVNQNVGCAEWLVKGGDAGLVYDEKNIDHLSQQLLELCRQSTGLLTKGEQGKYYLDNSWSANIAAERLVALTERLLRGESTEGLYTQGPCSPA